MQNIIWLQGSKFTSASFCENLNASNMFSSVFFFCFLFQNCILRLIQKSNYSFGKHSSIPICSRWKVLWHLDCNVYTDATNLFLSVFDTVEVKVKIPHAVKRSPFPFGWGLARLSLCVLPSLNVPGSAFLQWSQAKTGKKSVSECVCVYVCVFKRHWCNRFNRATLFELDVLTPRFLNGFLKWL